MSKKQLGAAQGGEADPQSARPGWVSRLRAQPGFRTAAVAFLLTVVLGIGGTAAYAYWSQRSDVLITGSAHYEPPAVTSLKCVSKFLQPNEIQWTVEAGAAEPETRTIVTFDIPSAKPKKTVSYAVPMNRSSIVPYTLAGLDEALGKSTNGVALHVTVKTALVIAPSNTVVKVEDHELLKPSAPVTLQSMKYYTILNGNYDCG